MKKVIMIISFVLLINITELQSQIIKGYGIKLGSSFTTQVWNFSPSSLSRVYDTRIGFDGGVFAEWFTSPMISLLTEAHFIQKGMTGKGIEISSTPTPVDNYSNAQRFSYLSFPVLAKVRQEFSTTTVYAIVGPRFDVLLQVKGDQLALSEKLLNKSEFGGSIGIGVETYLLSSYKFGLEYRYSPSFQKAMNVPNVSIQNRSMELLLSISY